MSLTDSNGVSLWKSWPESDDAKRRRLHASNPLPSPRKQPKKAQPKKEPAK